MKKKIYRLKITEPKPLNAELENKIIRLKDVLKSFGDTSVYEQRLEDLEAKKNLIQDKDEALKIDKKIDILNNLIKYENEENEHEDTQLIKLKLLRKIKELENSQQYDIDETRWELVDNSNKENKVVIDFSKVVKESIYNVESIKNTAYYMAQYYSWTGAEVMALINYKGKLIVKDITDFKILPNAKIIIYANGLRNGLGYEDDTYVSVIDGWSGEEILSPVKNESIKWDHRKKHYIIADTYFYDSEGNQIYI